jgi:hypothetical protein
MGENSAEAMILCPQGRNTEMPVTLVFELCIATAMQQVPQNRG